MSNKSSFEALSEEHTIGYAQQMCFARLIELDVRSAYVPTYTTTTILVR